MEHGKDGGVRADAEGKGQNCYDCEAGALPQHAHGVAKILQERFHSCLIRNATQPADRRAWRAAQECRKREALRRTAEWRRQQRSAGPWR